MVLKVWCRGGVAPVLCAAAAACVWLAAIALASTPTGPITVFTSSLGGLRLSRTKDVHFRRVDARDQDSEGEGESAGAKGGAGARPSTRRLPVTTVAVDDATRFQVIRGFGGSFLESGAINLNALPSAKQEELLAMLFNSSVGAGLTLMKAPIPCDDFCAAGPWYTYDMSPGDTELKSKSRS